MFPQKKLNKVVILLTDRKKERISGVRFLKRLMDNNGEITLLFFSIKSLTFF